MTHDSTNYPTSLVLLVVVLGDSSEVVVGDNFVVEVEDNSAVVTGDSFAVVEGAERSLYTPMCWTSGPGRG